MCFEASPVVFECKGGLFVTFLPDVGGIKYV